jgi:hypothetical protein
MTAITQAVFILDGVLSALTRQGEDGSSHDRHAVGTAADSAEDAPGLQFRDASHVRAQGPRSVIVSVTVELARTECHMIAGLRCDCDVDAADAEQLGGAGGARTTS